MNDWKNRPLNRVVNTVPDDTTALRWQLVRAQGSVSYQMYAVGIEDERARDASLWGLGQPPQAFRFTRSTESVSLQVLAGLG